MGINVLLVDTEIGLIIIPWSACKSGWLQKSVEAVTFETYPLCICGSANLSEISGESEKSCICAAFRAGLSGGHPRIASFQNGPVIN